MHVEEDCDNARPETGLLSLVAVASDQKRGSIGFRGSVLMRSRRF